VETYDPAKVGKRIAWGRSHAVYQYGDDEVLKVPRLERWLGARLEDRLERDISICREFFGEYFLDTRLVGSPDGKTIAAIQPAIAGHYLRKSDVADFDIKRRLDDFIGRYESMIKAGHAPVDLIGQGGVFRRCLSNVLVLEDKRLKLFDASILDTKDIEWGASTVRLIVFLVLKRQASTLRFLRS
jgi:hypothetical protein